jgi:thiol-disulfide isomerase/thioredoxin
MSKILIIVGIIIVIGGGIALLSAGGDSLNTETASDNLLELSFTDYKGNSVVLSDFAGKPMVVNAWAVWCPFCVKELPDFATIQQELNNDIVVIAINRRESLETAKSYTDNLGISNAMVFLLDSTDSFYKAIGGFSMPETIFIDSSGVVQDHKRGPMNIEEIRERIQKIL